MIHTVMIATYLLLGTPEKETKVSYVLTKLFRTHFEVYNMTSVSDFLYLKPFFYTYLHKWKLFYF